MPAASRVVAGLAQRLSPRLVILVVGPFARRMRPTGAIRPRDCDRLRVDRRGVPSLAEPRSPPACGASVTDLPLIAGRRSLTLVFLEGLLSADNALVLAVMVRHLPKRAAEAGAAVRDLGGVRVPADRRAALGGPARVLALQGGRRRSTCSTWPIAHFLVRARTTSHARRRRGSAAGSGATVVVGRAGRHRLLDRLDPRRRGDGRRACPPARRQLEARRSSTSAASSASSRCGSWPAISSSCSNGSRGWPRRPTVLVAWIGLKLVVSGLPRRKVVPLEIHEWLFWLGMLVIVVASLLY